MTVARPERGVLVSVIIPCYNAVLFIQETLNSIFSQTWSNLEVIIIDDGSTDGTFPFLAELRASGRSFSLIQQAHAGASAARNRGTDAAMGKYIQYCDADDLLAPDSIAQKVEVAEKSGADVVYSDWQRLSEGADGVFRAGEIVSRNIKDIHPSAEIAIFTDFWAPPAALLYRRRIVDKIGGWKESLPVIQDARFLLDAALSGASFARVPEVTAFYRTHRKDSLSSRDPRAFLQDIYTQALGIETVWKNRGGIDNERKRALLKVLGYVARQSFGSDRVLYRKVCETIRGIEPRYIPEKPQALRAASLLFGYDNAERIASVYRRLKKWLTPKNK